MEVLETAVGAVFAQNQVLLSKSFLSETCLQTEILTKEAQVLGEGVEILILDFCEGVGAGRLLSRTTLFFFHPRAPFARYQHCAKANKKNILK